MRLLILGGKGMAGHVITKYFTEKKGFQVFYTSRDKEDENGIFLDVREGTKVEELIERMKPDVTINCTGILNQHAANNPLQAFQVNSVLPHQLDKLTKRYQGKLIQISTDCVFSGKKGDYTEFDIPDGSSVYSQSKQLGEIISTQHLTIRTSIIGPELKENGIGLFSWFMKQQGEIKGYKHALWNGVTTLELAKAIEVMIRKDVTGLYHLGAQVKTSKYDLLKLIQDIFNKQDVTIIPDHKVKLDRTIMSTRTDFQYYVPSYKKMLEELKDWMFHNEREA
ncbi:dTDP-4-dehydrorhamnose reductase family protein [Halalkalibacterium halodurans]|uniref:dTDP-4-dehydrorhamnose reductase n=1 Tax=Halalkalibacterium halodurans TaxID=86665 RepID=A0A0M0KGB9_ALKHA|nr:SDR family oxidoreductase [Halalkalibacterium halodurans]TPE68326.1 SDR family oxidoreductase [Halalkalibacterium halodurans]